MTLEEYSSFDGLGLAELVKRGEVEPSELVELALAGIAKVDPTLNAVIETFTERIDEGRDNPLSGPFAGVPFLVKDFPIYEGVKAEFGCELFGGFTARHDSVLGTRLRGAGLVNLGRTTSSEFGLAATTENRLNGKTCNPWDPERSAAGSSGGSAASVAAGVVPVAQGGDGGGSIRMPASFCGLVGLKPSRGRVTGAPGDVAPLSGLASGFMLTRTVRDCAALLDVAEGPAPGDRFEIARPAQPFLNEVGRDAGRLRIAFVDTAWSGLQVDSSLVGAVRATAELCEGLGHHVEHASPKFDYERYLEAQKLIWWAHTHRDINLLAATAGRQPGPDTLQSTTLAVYERGKGLGASDFLGALEVHRDVSRRVGRFFTRFDILLTPTCTIEPTPLGTYDPDIPGATAHTLFEQLAPLETFTALFNATGLPALSLPLQETSEGLPLGMQFVARFGEEATLFRLAAALEAAKPWAVRRPQVHVAV